jgi:hypothetical protein
MRLPLISAIFASVALAGSMASAKGPKHDAEVKKEAAEASAPTNGLSGLLHASPDRVRAHLGEPAIARAEGKGAFWTYRASGCALYIFFRDDEGLKVSGAAVGPRKRGVPASDLPACLDELEQSQTGAANR